jgi:uncharacterized phage protein gp47/JayE
MSSFGVLSTGFVKKDVDTIVDELEAEFKTLFGDGLNVLPTSSFGQLISAIADRESDMWDLAEAVYNSQYPDTANDQSLDNVMAYTGVSRLLADETEGAVICTGLAATVLTVGRVVSSGADIRLASTAQATLSLATAWAVTTAYVLGDIRSNNNNIYVCVQAGTSAGAGGPTTTGDDIVDNTCKWDFVGDGLSYASVNFKAEDTGALAVLAGAIHTDAGTGAIETAVSGWEDARNIADLTTGRAEETDSAARIRRASLLQATGLATVDAIADAIANNVDNVTSVTGFENTGDVVDGDGLPAHSVEMVVLGGADQDIWDEIWASKAGGIETHGTETGTSKDRNGDNQTVNFNRPTEKRIHVIVEGTKDDDYPSDGDAQIKAAIVVWGDLLGVGTDVVQSLMYAVVTGISGVTDVTKLWISIHPVHPPVAGVNLTIGSRERSTWDTADIDVTMT